MSDMTTKSQQKIVLQDKHTYPKTILINMAIQFYEIEKKKIIMVVLDNNMLIFAEDT